MKSIVFINGPLFFQVFILNNIHKRLYSVMQNSGISI